MNPSPDAMRRAENFRGGRWVTWGIGAGAGFLNGLIGIGGGILIVPGLMFRHKMDVRAAVSTSLGAVMCLSSLAFVAHLALAGFQLDPLGSALTLPAGMAGAQVGGWLLNRLPRRVVILVFGSMTLFTASRILLQALGVTSAPLPVDTGPPLWAYPVFALVSGVFSGLLGVGGGAFVLLGFAVFFDTPVDGGLPLALGLNAANALSGTWAQRKTGMVHWPRVWALVPSALIGIGVGTALALTLPSDALRIAFSIFFLYMAGRLIRQALKG